MATITTGLALHDQMTSVVNGITRSLNLTLSAMDDMKGSMDSSFDDRSIIAARRAIQQTETAINNLEPPINRADREQERFNRSLKEGETNASGLLGKIAGFIGAYAGFRAISRTFSAGFDRLIGIDTGIAKLDALGHSGQAIEVIMDNAVTSVTGTAFRMEEAVSTAASAVAAGIRPGQQLERYLSLTADAAAIAGVNMSDMGAIFNKVTTSGMIQAQELNQIADRGVPIFQMLADEMGVTAREIRTLASEGQISSDIFLNAVESGFGGAAQTMGTASFQATLDNIGAAIGRISANFINGTGDGTGFFDQIKPRMVGFLDTLKSFEERAAQIGSVIGYVFNATYDAVGRVVGLIQDNWSWIQPILIAIASVYLVMIIAKLWSMVAPLTAIALKWLAINWPILLVISLIAGLIFILRKMGVSTEQILGFVGGLFGVLYATVYNVIARLWNSFAGFAEFFANVFNHPVYSAKKLFVDFVNSVLEAVKKVAKAIDWVFGSDLAGHISSLQDSMNEWLGDMPEGYKVIQRMEEQSLAEAAQKGYELGADLIGNIGDLLDGFDIPGQPDLPGMPGGAIDIDHIGMVDEVGRINDSVDISSEDLKTMRELAEMRSIQNFVTLQPSFNVQTGDIHENADLDVLVSRLEREFEDEIARSAEGVFT